MATAASLAGIQVHGHRWRYTLSLRGQPARLADEDSLVVGDVLVIRDSIVRDLRAFLERKIDAPDDDLRFEIEKQVDELEMIGDDPDDLKLVLNDLYDVFDFHRVCIVA